MVILIISYINPYKAGASDFNSDFNSEITTPAQVEDFVVYQAQKQGVDVSLARAIVYCESTFNPKAKSKISTATGPFQFLKSTWAETNRRMLWMETQDVKNARLNIIAGIWLLKKDGVRHWRESEACWGKQIS